MKKLQINELANMLDLRGRQVLVDEETIGLGPRKTEVARLLECAKQPALVFRPGVAREILPLELVVLSGSLVHVLSADALATCHLTTGDSLPGDVEGPAEDGQEIPSDATAREDETIACAVSQEVVQR